MFAVFAVHIVAPMVEVSPVRVDRFFYSLRSEFRPTYGPGRSSGTFYYVRVAVSAVDSRSFARIFSDVVGLVSQFAVRRPI